MVGATVVARAGEQIITLRDWTGLGFAPQVFGYDVPIDITGANNGFLRLNVT